MMALVSLAILLWRTKQDMLVSEHCLLRWPDFCMFFIYKRINIDGPE